MEYIAVIKLERGCVDCGFNLWPEALEFDHLPGTTKLFNVSDVTRRSDKALLDAEIAKCEVVCSNCHKHRTARRRVGVT
jgi:hypothetical protein